MLPLKPEYFVDNFFSKKIYYWSNLRKALAEVIIFLKVE